MAETETAQLRPYGVNRDVSPVLVDGSQWNDVDGVRFRELHTEPSESYQYRTPSPRYAPEQLIYNRIGALDYWYYAGTDGIGLNAGGADYDVSPVGWGAVSAGLHYFTNLNGVVVWAHPEVAPQYHAGITSNPFVTLPNWPAGWLAKGMRAFKYHLHALAVTESGTPYRNQIRWSKAAGPNEIPDEWIPSATNDARDMIFADTPGEVVDLVPLRNQAIVYKEASAYQLNYIGGVYVYGQRKLFDSLGLIAPECAAEFHGQHFQVGEGDIIIHDGSRHENIADKAVKREIFDNMNDGLSNRAFTYHDIINQALHFCWPSKGASDWPDMRATWRYGVSENRWSVEQLPNERSHAAVGSYGISGAATTWSGMAGQTWATAKRRWSADQQRGVADQVLTAFATLRELGEELPEGGGRAGTAIKSRMAVYTKDLGAPGFNKLVTRLWFEGGAATPVDMKVRIGTQDSSGDAIYWHPVEETISFKGAGEQYADFYVKGRYFSVEVEVETITRWWIDGLRFEFQRKGAYG